MPRLANARRETFCQLVAAGTPMIDAYREAGYKPSNAAAYELGRDVNMNRRIAEIRREMVSQAAGMIEAAFNPDEVDHKWLVTQLYQNVQIGREQGDISASTKALELIGKLNGLYIGKGDKQLSRNPQHHGLPNRRKADDIQEIAGFLERLDSASGDDGQEGDDA